jgi:hypothetical protein
LARDCSSPSEGHRFSALTSCVPAHARGDRGARHRRVAGIRRTDRAPAARRRSRRDLDARGAKQPSLVRVAARQRSTGRQRVRGLVTQGYRFAGAGRPSTEKIDYFGFVLPNLMNIQLKVVSSILATSMVRGLHGARTKSIFAALAGLFAASKARMANLRRDNARRS